jgi:hypothetical protein
MTDAQLAYANKHSTAWQQHLGYAEPNMRSVLCRPGLFRVAVPDKFGRWALLVSGSCAPAWCCCCSSCMVDQVICQLGLMLLGASSRCRCRALLDVDIVNQGLLLLVVVGCCCCWCA